MWDFHEATFSGVVCAAPEKKLIKSAKGEVSTASFTVAVHKGKTPDGVEKTDFLRCRAWDSHADRLLSTLKKGAKVVVTADVEAQREYTDKDGKTQQWVEYRVRRVHFDSRADATQTAAKPKSNGNGSYRAQQQESEIPF